MNKQKYIDIFVNIFEVDENELNESFTFQDVDAWDSFTHLTLIGELEATFDVMFDPDDILHFGGFENGMRILSKYGVNFEQ